MANPVAQSDVIAALWSMTSVTREPGEGQAPFTLAGQPPADGLDAGPPIAQAGLDGFFMRLPESAAAAKMMAMLVPPQLAQPVATRDFVPFARAGEPPLLSGQAPLPDRARPASPFGGADPAARAPGETPASLAMLGQPAGPAGKLPGELPVTNPVALPARRIPAASRIRRRRPDPAGSVPAGDAVAGSGLRESQSSASRLRADRPGASAPSLAPAPGPAALVRPAPRRRNEARRLGDPLDGGGAATIPRVTGIRVFQRTYRAPKRYRDGTHRACAPETTLARARKLMRRMGITRLANLTGLDCLGIPVYAAIRPNGRSLSTSQGKGLSDSAAAASALMESIETWHAEHIQLPRRRGSVRGLRGSPAAGRRARPAARPPGAKLDLDARLDWVKAWDLLGQAPVWVPLESVTLDCVFPPGHVPAFDVGSNGLASGNHLLEAIVHGLCEVIERDAEARWRLARGQRRLDLAPCATRTAGPCWIGSQSARVRITVWDITSDVGVPAYGCAIMEDPREPAWRALGLYQGFGCHLDAPVALARALSEAVQTRLSYISGSRDDFFPHDYERATDQPLLTADLGRAGRAAGREPVAGAGAPAGRGARSRRICGTLLSRLAPVGSDRRWWWTCPDPDWACRWSRCWSPAGPPASTSWAERMPPSPRTVVFLGPTLPLAQARALLPDAEYRPPAAMGDVYRLARRRPPARLALIDGYFEQVAAVWHKELLYAMERGVAVYGAASMGALRAAELHRFGMVGVGRIFTAYRRGQLVDDDEVAVAHGPAAFGYPRFSEAMVNVRDALARARGAGVISARVHDRLVALAKAPLLPGARLGHDPGRRPRRPPAHPAARRAGRLPGPGEPRSQGGRRPRPAAPAGPPGTNADPARREPLARTWFWRQLVDLVEAEIRG